MASDGLESPSATLNSAGSIAWGLFDILLETKWNFPSRKEKSGLNTRSEIEICVVLQDNLTSFWQKALFPHLAVTCLQLSARVLPFIPVLSSRRRLRKIVTNISNERTGVNWFNESILSNIFYNGDLYLPFFFFLLSKNRFSILFARHMNNFYCYFCSLKGKFYKSKVSMFWGEA